MLSMTRSVLYLFKVKVSMVCIYDAYLYLGKVFVLGEGKDPIRDLPSPRAIKAPESFLLIMHILIIISNKLDLFINHIDIIV